MKTAIDWFNEQIKLNSEFRENLKGRVSFTIGLSKIDELYNQAKEMEKEQIKQIREMLMQGVLTNMSCASAIVELDKLTFKSE